MRLKVVRSVNWKRETGWRWTCLGLAGHPSGGVISGFTADDGWTVRLRAKSRNPLPPAQSRAMDGARRHLIRYHLED